MMKAEKFTLEEYNKIVNELRVHQIEVEMQNDELRKTQSELERIKARYFDIYDLAPEGYLIVSASGRIIESNLTAAEMLGETRHSFINKKITDYIFSDYQDAYYKYRKLLLESEIPQVCDLKMITKNKSVIWGHMKTSIVNEDGVVSYRMVISDITERKDSADQLVYLSTHDHLTGLYNRRYFESQLLQIDTQENLPLSIIMFDVNGLKLVNDSFGHDLGDVLLNKASETIKKACRKDDFIARIGGDEFVLVLPKTSKAETEKIASHIKLLTSKVIVANIELSISFGYDTKETINQLISETVVEAENHMYKHKLYERTSIRSKTIELILNTLFEKSGDEAQHSAKVSDICQAIAVKLELDSNKINQMRVVGLIHDIGKIGIDEKILNKEGSLSNNERIEMERHPEIGWRLLSSSSEYAELAQYVINHHEKWDGSGYPNGIKGESIQLEARIIAVAEAYAAMTSDRSFDNKLTSNEASKELARCSGTHFDPIIVAVFLDMTPLEK